MDLASSPVVCHIPDCATTQAEIQEELQRFLTGYCSICKKSREGKLCGCAFPCSLTFRAQMMIRIHELLGIEKPPERKAIQVILIDRNGFVGRYLCDTKASPSGLLQAPGLAKEGSRGLLGQEGGGPGQPDLQVGRGRLPERGVAWGGRQHRLDLVEQERPEGKRDLEGTNERPGAREGQGEGERGQEDVCVSTGGRIG